MIQTAEPAKRNDHYQQGNRGLVLRILLRNSKWKVEYSRAFNSGRLPEEFVTIREKFFVSQRQFQLLVIDSGLILIDEDYHGGEDLLGRHQWQISIAF